MIPGIEESTSACTARSQKISNAKVVPGARMHQEPTQRARKGGDQAPFGVVTAGSLQPRIKAVRSSSAAFTQLSRVLAKIGKILFSRLDGHFSAMPLNDGYSIWCARPGHGSLNSCSRQFTVYSNRGSRRCVCIFEPGSVSLRRCTEEDATFNLQVAAKSTRHPDGASTTFQVLFLVIFAMLSFARPIVFAFVCVFVFVRVLVCVCERKPVGGGKRSSTPQKGPRAASRMHECEHLPFH